MSNQQNITAVNPMRSRRDGANEDVACCLVTAGLPESTVGGWMESRRKTKLILLRWQNGESEKSNRRGMTEKEEKTGGRK